jgi:hypothetical protein
MTGLLTYNYLFHEGKYRDSSKVQVLSLVRVWQQLALVLRLVLA